MRVLSLGQQDPLEKEVATHSGILAWEIPWTQEPGGLQAMGSQRVGHDQAEKQELLGSSGDRIQRQACPHPTAYL